MPGLKTCACGTRETYKDRFRRGQCGLCVRDQERRAKNRMLARTWPQTDAGRLTCRPWTGAGQPAGDVS
jgi:hypothetical protein